MTETRVDQLNRIEELIQIGRENAISRKELVLLTGYPDRDIRAAIEASNRPIINIGRGYFIPDRNDETDLALEAAYIRSEQMRVESLLYKLERKFGVRMETELALSNEEAEQEPELL